MTIAACYLSPEGVVLGADSAATFGSRNHFFHEQKIYEIGKPKKSSLGITLWGLASMGDMSYRTIIGRFSDDEIKNPGRPVKDSAERWRELFWESYKAQLADKITRIKELMANTTPSFDEQEELDSLIDGYSGGFCLGGYALSDRLPQAFTVKYSPENDNPDPLEEVEMGSPEFWGQPNMLKRLALGIDFITFSDIIDAQKPDGTPMWTGGTDDLARIVVSNKLGQPSKHLPIREAIDWVYSSIYTTIKAMKFANLPPVCGGPIEIAVITTDRPFRWVRHKELDTAIGRHPTRET